MELKELYKAAKNQLAETITTENPDFRLEQVEYNEAEKIWDMVVSFLVPSVDNSPVTFNSSVNVRSPLERVYKRVKINDKKEVTGFYIYQ
jgi:hypothetical protein